MKHFNQYDAFRPDKAVSATPPAPKPKKVLQWYETEPVPSERQYIGQRIYIKPSYVVSLPEYDRPSDFRSLDQQANQANLLNNDHAGLLSSKAISKMRSAINWMLCSADDKNVWNKKYKSWFKFKINFITLTLPDTSKKIDNRMLQKQLLNPLFTYLRKYNGLKNYVWKLEFQKNGKLHVHFISDTFIHHAAIRSAWNRLLKSNGHLQDFFKKYKHENPNSTDVHSVRKIKNLAAYLIKYMSKSQKELAQVKGRIWGCNRELSTANKTCLFVDRNELHKAMPCLVQSDIPFKKIEFENPVTKIKKAFGEIFFLQYNDWFTTMRGTIKDAFDNTILFLKNTHFTKEQLLTT